MPSIAIFLRTLLVVAAVLQVPFASGYRRRLTTCDCSCEDQDGNTGVGVILVDAELIVANGGIFNLCVSSEEAAEHFELNTGECDFDCNYDAEDGAATLNQATVDLDALDF